MNRQDVINFIESDIRFLFSNTKGKPDRWRPTWVQQRAVHKNALFMGTSCTCLGDNHELTMCVEYEKEDNEAHITFWSTLSCEVDTFDAWHWAFNRRERKTGRIPDEAWDNFIIWLTKWPDVINILYRRFKKAIKFMFTGYAEWEGGITFNNKEHVQDLLMALWWARENVVDSKLLPPTDGMRPEYDFSKGIRGKASEVLPILRSQQLTEQDPEEGKE